MGFPKALLPIGNEVFVTRIVGIVERLALAQPLVVIGRHAAQIEPVIAGRARVIVNPDPGRGQLSSIQLALVDVKPEIVGALVWPVDQPAISAELVEALVQRFIASEPPIALPSYRGRQGHPAVFHRSLFEALLRLPSDRGAKGLVLQQREHILVMPTDEAAVIDDIDTPEDYRRLTGVAVPRNP
jgi:molybdenum cofactor cytidylyltransferase